MTVSRGEGRIRTSAATVPRQPGRPKDAVAILDMYSGQGRGRMQARERRWAAICSGQNLLRTLVKASSRLPRHELPKFDDQPQGPENHRPGVIHTDVFLEMGRAADVQG